MIGITFEQFELRTELIGARMRQIGIIEARTLVTHYVSSMLSASSSRSNPNELHKNEKGAKVLRTICYLSTMEKRITD